MALQMVSQKEKQRLREGSKRRESYDQLHVTQAQASLVIKLQELLSGQQKQKTIAKSAKKLIKDMRYTEELDKIGLDATKLALKIYYQYNRPGDALELLKEEQGVASEDAYCWQIGLWAAGKKQSWQAGLPFAKHIFRSDDDDDDKTDSTRVENADTISPSLLELQHYAIQTFAATDCHIETATKLLTHVVLEADGPEKVDQDLSQASLESLLKSHQSAARTQEFKNLFVQFIEEDKNLSLATGFFLLKESSFDMALEVAAKNGDIELMHIALENNPSEEQSVAQQFWILDTIASYHGSGGIRVYEPEMALTFAVLKALLSSDAKHAANLDFGFVSQVICSLEDPGVLELAFLLHYGPDGRPTVANNKETKSKSNKKKGKKKSKSKSISTSKTNAPKASPLFSLSDSARARIFKLLGMWEVQETGARIAKTSVVLELFLSFLKFDKTSGALSDSTRALFRSQTAFDFHWLALNLSEEFVENRKGFQGVFEECWPYVFKRPTSEEDFWLLDQLFTLLKKVFPFEDDVMTKSLFSDVLSKFTFPTEKSPVDTSDLPVLQNEKVSTIMTSTVRWLRENADTMARTNQGLAIALMGMQLVTVMKECSGRYIFSNEGTADNGAKEALQAIMKEILVLDLFQTDIQMADAAILYYRELGFAAQASSTISSSDLFFLPTEERWIRFLRRQDGYDIREEFRSIVLGKPKATAGKAGFFKGMMKNAIEKSLSQISEAEISDESIACLQDVIREMAFYVDQRNDSDFEDRFIRDYRALFLEKTPGLFLDFQLSYELCNAYQEQSDIQEVLDGLKLPGGVEVMLDSSDGFARHWTNPLLSDDFAKRLIERLDKLEDIRFSMTLAEETREPKEERLENFVSILFHLYDLAPCFVESESIYKDYLDAADRNAAFVVDQTTKVLDTRKTVLNKGNRAKGKSMVNNAFISMEEFFVQVSKSAKEWRSPGFERAMVDRLETIQPLVSTAFGFYDYQTAGYTRDRVRKEWLTNEAILPKIRKWIQDELQIKSDEGGTSISGE